MDKLVYSIWLSLACSPGGSSFPKLCSAFDSPEQIFGAELSEISRVIGYRNSDRKALADKSLEKATEIYEFCRKHKVGIVTYFDDKYPALLREISSPPVLFYYRGRLPDFSRAFTVAAVGTRALTEYGRKSAFKISYDLAASGAVIVSGMATGIDGVAMAGALSAGGSTVAVLGSGIDVCYPPQHLTLAREIVKTGCIITEYAPGTKPNRFNFPKRNRIISALSQATLVFEGEERSGALITARYAAEEGRPVYALPGNVGSKKSELTNLLLKQGAKPFTSAEDIIGDFEQKFANTLNRFNLKDKMPVDMMAQLRRLEVVAVCPSDDIFLPPVQSHPRHTVSNPEYNVGESVPAEPILPPASFDKSALEIYKQIPTGDSCAIESLVNEKYNFRTVMRLLLKLEMNGFVSMLPGERVARKTK